ncbi:hypothetical protein ACP70R_024403 [Stipagrostis hirtigluma subsp. patula]
MEPLPPSLPVDLQLKIIARSDDVATVVRCAAASKLLRGAILDPGFHRRLALRAGANGGFDPALLVAVSYLFQTAAVRRDTAVSDHATVQPPWGLLQSFQLASARDGLKSSAGIGDHASGVNKPEPRYASATPSPAMSPPFPARTSDEVRVTEASSGPPCRLAYH